MLEKRKQLSEIEQLERELTQISEGVIPEGVEFHKVSYQELPEFGSQDLKAIRAQNKLTQAQLAIILAVSPRTVEAWEIGRSKPNGSARRLLQLISVDPKLAQAILDMTVRQA